MRRIAPVAATAAGVRAITGVAPVIHFPETTPKLSKSQQIEKNTQIALALTKKFKGELPAPYTRKYTQTAEQIEKEIETLLGGAAKLRKTLDDDQPMDKLTLMERCLRHGLWSYRKDEGKHDFEQYKKWLVYTAQDESRVSLLKRDVELKEKLSTLKAKRAAENGPAISLPEFDWAKEYANVIDREVVAEKRVRYDSLAVTSRDKDEKQIEALNAAYKKATQDQRLDNLVELLERFKPVLAREAIMQRLTVKHLEGQLGIWRYLDWCPEVRDRAELEVDNNGVQWWMQWEEKRLAQIRLRSKAEVAEVMEKTQASKVQAKSTTAVSKGSNDEARDKLLKEVLALQARMNARDEDAPAADDKKAAAKH